MRTLILILALCMPVMAQDWRQLTYNAQTVVEGYYQYDTNARSNYVRAWIRLTDRRTSKSVRARIIIDCNDYAHRVSVNGGAYGKWIFFSPGEMGWTVSDYYCGIAYNEWQ